MKEISIRYYVCEKCSKRSEDKEIILECENHHTKNPFIFNTGDRVYYLQEGYLHEANVEENKVDNVELYLDTFHKPKKTKKDLLNIVTLNESVIEYERDFDCDWTYDIPEENLYKAYDLEFNSNFNYIPKLKPNEIIIVRYKILTKHCSKKGNISISEEFSVDYSYDNEKIMSKFKDIEKTLKEFDIKVLIKREDFSISIPTEWCITN